MYVATNKYLHSTKKNVYCAVNVASSYQRDTVISYFEKNLLLVLKASADTIIIQYL